MRLSTAQILDLAAAGVPSSYAQAVSGGFKATWEPEQVTHPTAAEEIISLHESGLPLEYAAAMFDGGAA